MNTRSSGLPIAIAFALNLALVLSTATSYAQVEAGSVTGQWGVWSGWFWPFNDTEPPNLFASGEALSRYDAFAGSSSQAWELANHGPVLNQPNWAGHCHAWAGASVWETMPVTNRICGGITFRPRDIAALMTEAYYNDTLATEFSFYRPSPGLLWRYLRQEILGQNSIHGHAMAIIGNLTQILGQVWNYPIYQYQVDYAINATNGTYAGTITLWYADDSSPGYADSLGLGSASVTYQFSGVSLDQAQLPLDSGNWAGGDPSYYPTSLWRPYYAISWDNYLANPQLDAAHLSPILDVLALGDALDAPSLKWTTGGDATWEAETATSHDLTNAVQSGSIGTNQSSWIETTVTGPGTISFWWKVSSASGHDFLRFMLDGQEQPGSISGSVGWQLESFAVPGASTNSHTLLWVYAKDAVLSAGSDAAWLDQVSWTPAVCQSMITTTSSPTAGGSTTGAGAFNCASNVTVCATPNAGYYLLNWTESGNVLSSSPCYTFTATTNHSLVANFSPGSPLLSASRVGNQLVLNWETKWAGYLLEACTNTGPVRTWSQVTSNPPPAGNLYSVTNPIGGECKYYRLRHP